ncbi:hypothetical protein A2477_00230 [Candidatus Falkowbacteria bacterium RIFOXYC2_FULL_47_12]|uniref:Uncharacterized protein n=2 Tax=Candidatus Falkowiibacteriota TaxID=1752728 RepID=A0A1F5TRC3_9BACT|nr:MAG: hypothetical protein A2242_04055 [Candidatus Falkowbacteria bacterium RIFOXYA2_FULL_47_9]OGF41101.1 MAG: hypothetical protein A2477_00230 [Candidatus Falkowbacteria bacterium RIFOXYC2_FULL_47_12]
MLKIYKKLRWRHVLVLVLLLSMALVPYLVFAVGEPTENDGMLPIGGGNGGAGATRQLFDILGQSAGYETGPQNSVGNVVAIVINAVLALVGMIFLIEVFYGGYLWMTAQGNDEQVTKAKELIRQAVIGVIVIVAAYAIVYFVLSNLLEVGGADGTTAG